MKQSSPKVGGGILAVSLLLSACGGSGTLPPSISHASAQANQYNVLSSLFQADVGAAVKVLVTYTPETGPSGTTPDFTVTSGQVSVPVLGLMPETNYTLRLTAIGAAGMGVDSDAVSFRTGALPSTLPVFTVTEQPGSEPGFTMVSLIQGIFSGSTASITADSASIAGPLIVDNTGRIVWYREAFDGVVTDWQRQPDGTFTAAINGTDLGELGYSDTRYVQLDNLGNVLRTYLAIGQWPTDNHELRLLSNGDALLMAINTRNMDLTPWGGRPSVDVSGNILERISPTGQLLFAWNALDRLDIGSADPLILRDLADADELDFTHANAIDLCADGSYLISLRHLSQLVKVDRSGSIAWRLGGIGSDFDFINDPLRGFSFQHGARELPNGNILLFDNGNGHQPQQSRAAEYQLDLDAKTATLVWQYNPEPPIFGPFMGFTQRLSNGNTLITYGARAVIQEVNAAGQLVWELRGADTDGFYRAIRIPSLY
jgi:hypothetical protein